ncbi:MAG TPA: hypothetical protein DCX12_01115 [Chloroflexi bacterium]|nr:hypothetical protein [Chloroflexota bacterium]
MFRRLAAKSGGIIPRDWGDWCECLALWRVNLRAWRASAKSYAARYGRRARLTRLAVYQRETARQHAREVIEALRLIRVVVEELEPYVDTSIEQRPKRR